MLRVRWKGSKQDYLHVEMAVFCFVLLYPLFYYYFHCIKWMHN